MPDQIPAPGEHARFPERQVPGPQPLHPPPLARRQRVGLPLLVHPVEQLSNGRVPSAARGKHRQPLTEQGIHASVFDELFAEMRCDNGDASFAFQFLLARGRDEFAKRAGVFGIRGGKPERHERP